MRKSLVLSPRVGPKDSARTTKPGLEIARNMNDFSPVQQFQKQFSALDLAMTKLRHLNPPEELTQMFDEFDSLKKGYSVFIESCQAVLRQRKLGNESKGISEDHVKVISSFTTMSNTFFTMMVGLNSRKPEIFYAEAKKLSSVMQDAVIEFAGICGKEQQTRRILKQYDNALRYYVSELETQIHDLFKKESFERISQEKVNEVVEIAKKLSRVFETDLQHGLFTQKMLTSVGSQYVSKFHAGFVGLVPLLANIPPFNELLANIFVSVETYSEILKRVMEDTQVESDADPISIPIDANGDVTESADIKDGLIRLDPVTYFLEEFSELLGCSSERRSDKLEWCEEILATARQRIHDLEYENHQLKTKVLSKEFITSETALTDRYPQNKKFQEELVHEYAKEKEHLLRSLVATVKTLVPGEILHHDDDYETQVQTLVMNCRINMDNAEKKLHDYEQLMQTTRSTLRQFYKSQFYQDIDEEADLHETAEILIARLTKLHKKLDEKITAASAAQNELNMFLKSVLHGRLEEVDGLTGAQLKKGLISCICSLEQELEETKKKLSDCIENHNEFERQAVECISKVQSRLSMATNIEQNVTSSSFEVLAPHVLGMFEQFEKETDAQNTFRKFLCSFLSQLRFALGLPKLSLINLSREDLQDVMVGILDSPPVQEGLGLSRHRPPNQETLSRGNDAENTRPTSRARDADPQFVFKVHSYLADRCGQVQGCSSSGFMHVPVDKLMDSLTKLIQEKNDYVKALRSVINDIAIRIGQKYDQKEAESVDVDVLARDIFTGLENLFTKADQNSVVDAIPEIVALIHEDDMKQFDLMNLRPIDCVKAELQKVKHTPQVLEPVLKITRALSEDLEKQNQIVLSSPEFDRCMEQIENLRTAANHLPAHQVHPTFYPFVEQAVTVLSSLATKIGSVVFAEKLSEDKEKVAEVIANKQEMESTIKKLTHQISDQVQEIQRIKARFGAFIEASRTIVQDRSAQLTEIHNTEIAAIIDCYMDD